MSDKKILIVDDSKSIREVLGSVLEENGFQTVRCEDGDHALNTVESHKDFKLIMTDINMPNRNGISLIEELRKIEEFKYTPILVLTTESQTEMKTLAKEAGATGWIVKPFDKVKLLATINKVMR